MAKLSKADAERLAERIETLLTNKVRGSKGGAVPAKPERNRQIILDIEAAQQIARSNGQSNTSVLADVGARHGISRQRVYQIVRSANRDDLLSTPVEMQEIKSNARRDLYDARCRLAIVLRVEHGLSWYRIAELLGLYTTLDVDGETTQVVDTMRLVKSVRRYCKRNGKDARRLFVDPTTLKGKSATKAWRAHVLETGLLIEDFGLDRDNLNIPPELMEQVHGLS